MDRPGKPHWRPGRDDPMNLTKYFMTGMPEDDTTGPGGLPFHLEPEGPQGPGAAAQLERRHARGALGDHRLRARPGRAARRAFLRRMEEIDTFLSERPPPAWPAELPIDAALAAAARPSTASTARAATTWARRTRTR